jgi:hypothetical protein
MTASRRKRQPNYFESCFYRYRNRTRYHTPHVIPSRSIQSIDFHYQILFQTSYFMFALPWSGFELTGSPLMPWVPGLFWLGSWPTLVEPESEATGASPGRWPSVWPAALSAPRPCFSACCFWNFSLAPEPPLIDVLAMADWGGEVGWECWTYGVLVTIVVDWVLVGLIAWVLSCEV